jgi:hypothetical protein
MALFCGFLGVKLETLKLIAIVAICDPPLLFHIQTLNHLPTT